MKKIMVTLMVIIMLLLTCNYSLAREDKPGESGGSTLGGFVSDFKADLKGTKKQFKDVRTLIGKVLGFLQIASGLITIVIISWVGFRYIVEMPETKSEIRRTMTPIVVGMILVFGATSIARFIIKIAEKSA